ncbi:MAG: MFS transporter [Chloroflexi bacterium]|nr:MFS transporter [Chloroflexota bacterium]
MNLNRNLKLIAASLFLWASGEGLFLFVLPNYMQSLGADAVQIGVLFSISAVARAVSMIPAGLVTDRFGPRVALVGGWVVGVITGVMMALSTNFFWFSVAFVLYNSTGWVIPALSTYIARGRGNLTPERALSSVFSMYSGGLILAPFVGGMIGEQWGLRMPFVGAMIMFCVSTGFMLLIEYQPPHPAEDRLSPMTLVTNRHFTNFLFLIFGVIIALNIGFDLAPKFLADVKMINVAQIGWIGSINAIGGFLLNQLLGRRPPRRGLMLLMGLILIYSLILVNTSWIGWFALAYFLRGGYFSFRSLIGALVTRLVPPAQFGTSMAVAETVMNGAAATAPALAGLMYEKIAPASPFQLMWLLVPIAIFCVWQFAPKYEGEGRASVILKVSED